MAKKQAGKSLSQSIRDHLQANPSATPNQIVEALAKQGVKVSPGLASNVKYTPGPGAKRSSSVPKLRAISLFTAFSLQGDAMKAKPQSQNVLFVGID